MTTNTTTLAPAATDPAREQLLNAIIGRLERVNATPVERVDWPQEAMDIIEEVEAWAVERHPDGYLVLRDPADEVTREAI